ncbi:MAG: glutaredoxin 3 [Gammaproteobacteria bacterium]|nr:glutaredoxin 3 [Gammaproteobacteria bacterium]
MTQIEIYLAGHCPYCVMAKRLLESKGLGYEVIDVSGDVERRREMLERSGGRHTVPQIFIDGESIGGYDELSRLNAAGQLG